MKKNEAQWSAELWVDCPYCEEYQQIEYDKIDEWWGVVGNICESTNDLNHVHQCEECKKEFIVENTNW